MSRDRAPTLAEVLEGSRHAAQEERARLASIGYVYVRPVREGDRPCACETCHSQGGKTPATHVLYVEHQYTRTWLYACDAHVEALQVAMTVGGL